MHYDFSVRTLKGPGASRAKKLKFPLKFHRLALELKGNFTLLSLLKPSRAPIPTGDLALSLVTRLS